MIEFGKVVFTPGSSPGDGGQRFGDALSTGWALNARVLDYLVPTGKQLVSENLLIEAHISDAVGGANTVTPLTLSMLGKLELVRNNVVYAEFPVFHPGHPQNPGGGGHGRFQQWQPDCRAPLSFDDGIVLDTYDLVARFTPAATTNPPVALTFTVATSSGMVGASALIPCNSVTAVNTTIASAGVTVYSVAFHVSMDWPLLSMLLVRVNGGVWWQGMNIGSPAATSGCQPWNVSVPLYSTTFNAGDRIVVGAHVSACVGQVVTAQLVGQEVPVAGGLVINRRLVVRR